MMNATFLGFVALMALVVIGLIVRYRGLRAAGVCAAALVVWFLYVGCMGYFGVIRNIASRPPGPVFLFVPVIALLVVFFLRLRSDAGARVAAAFPLWILLGMQCFRVAVELFLHQMWHAGLVPKMLTFEGANLDIYVGASAPVVAWLATRGKAGVRLAFIWNILGLVILANVVVRAVLTAPGPLNLIHAEIPNLMIGTFPFMFVPGFFVPLAVVLHGLALRAISTARRQAVSG